MPFFDQFGVNSDGQLEQRPRQINIFFSSGPDLQDIKRGRSIGFTTDDEHAYVTIEIKKVYGSSSSIDIKGPGNISYKNGEVWQGKWEISLHQSRENAETSFGSGTLYNSKQI